MSHGAGLYNLMHVMKGAGHVCPVSGGFDPEEIFALGAILAQSICLQPHYDQTPYPPYSARSLQRLAHDCLRRGPMYLADIEEAVDIFGDIFVQILLAGNVLWPSLRLVVKMWQTEHPRWKDRLASVGKVSPVEVVLTQTADRCLSERSVRLCAVPR